MVTRAGRPSFALAVATDNCPMHLMISHASALDDACEQTLQTLALPHLATLLAALQAQAPIGGDEFAPLMPQELAQAQAWGWQPGRSAFAAAQAEDDGLETAGQAWALLTPLHLNVTSDQITALHPALLQLDAAESRAFLDALAPLFPVEEGWRFAWGAATRWYVAHPDLAEQASASLDRVINRNVDPWMPETRLLRRLQNELQMLLHRLPLNEQREARGALALNSVWISGCGQALPRQPDPALQLDSRLREPLLTQDWAAWREAWQALDAGPVRELLDAQQAGTPVALTLCGERSAQRWESRPRSGLARLWQRIAAPRADIASTLAAL